MICTYEQLYIGKVNCYIAKWEHMIYVFCYTIVCCLLFEVYSYIIDVGVGNCS